MGKLPMNRVIFQAMLDLPALPNFRGVFSNINWLMVSNIYYFPFHIWDVIRPIDLLHHFSRWLLHHQAVNIDVPGMINDGNLAGRIRMIQAQSAEAAPEIRQEFLHKLCSNGHG